MDATYWNLFWTTGMPEAWMMSRGPTHPAESAKLEELSSPMLGAQPNLSSNVPGGPEWLY